jgi:hypothetical protein
LHAGRECDAASRGGCQPTADDKWKGVGTLLSTSSI